jgi:hypothetical protein
MKTEKTLSVDAKLFFAIAQFRARNDVRYYLNGVHIAPCASGGVLITATNGNALAVIRDPDGSVSAPIIVPVSDEMERAFKKLKSGGFVTTEGGWIALTNVLKHTVHIQPNDAEVDGKFPEWRRVFPEESREGALIAWIDPAYLAMFNAAAQLLSTGKAFMRFYGGKADDSAIVRIADRPDFVGIVMPGRVTNGQPPLPDWFIAERETAKAKSQEPQAAQSECAVENSPPASRTE